MRQACTHHVLSLGCLDQVLNRGMDTCGARFSNIPFNHFPGNMWIASCDYVRHLPDPTAPRGEPCPNGVIIDLGGGKAWCDKPVCLAGARYRYEHWIASFTDAHTSDCMGYDTHNPEQYRGFFVLSNLSLVAWRDMPDRCGPAPKADLLAAFAAARLQPTRLSHKYRAKYLRCSNTNALVDRTWFGPAHANDTSSPPSPSAA
eukprot:TRINITY_DN770_c0_g1_i10.p1 TRINITY_DN770_c0_g1~~TRINITY_DN770_c0_g1_i10.p1  ORF type:complete len:226 (-),score=29.41 TRINITY_DN770_c0_g1_i10:367-972(-)